MLVKRRYVEMESQEEKNKRRINLQRQHLTEWNALLDQETQSRGALETQHRDEQAYSYREEINMHDRALLETQQRQAVNVLVQQNRLTRIDLLKRHKQEGDALDQPLK